MLLEGVVTNVTNFGAFVDIGVHQDGLVHVSALAARFVKDPHEVVKAGDVVKVKVLEVDALRKRIALTMRLADELPSAGIKDRGNRNEARQIRPGVSAGRDAGKPTPKQREAEPGGTMAAAFAKLRR
jgi:uncharacterized protein